MKKKTIKEELEEFLEYWEANKMAGFLRDIEMLYVLFDVDQADDWVQKNVGSEDVDNVRLIRAVYLLSRIAEFHGGSLLMLNTRFPKLWRRMDKMFKEEKKDGQEDKKDRERDEESGQRLEAAREGG